MAQYELEGLFSASLDGLKGMVDTETVVGKPVVTADGTTIIPITKLSLGYGMGGWNYGDEQKADTEKHEGITAGSGGGMSVQPVGFLVVADGNVNYINVNSVSTVEKICDIIPDALSVISDFLKKDK